jgi:sugar lactone lactonase YvrE
MNTSRPRTMDRQSPWWQMVFALLVLALAQPLRAVTVTTSAQAAVGQPNLITNTLNLASASGLFYPLELARDRSVSQTRLYVADANNSRVLGFECAGSNCSLATAAAAVRVYGQPDFSSVLSNGGLGGGVSALTLSFPRGVVVDPSGRLFVADTNNNRVLVYANPWTDSSATMVLGQTSMSNAGAGAGLGQLNVPEGLFADGAGHLWVADTGNHRILRFSTIATGASADFAVGGFGAASATTLSSPRGVAVDSSGRLWVADTAFSRILAYDAPVTSGKPASRVLGHGGSFASGAANDGGLSAASLGFPAKVLVDDAGRLWVADTGNNRVLEYDTPLSSDAATRVYGQADRSQVPTFSTNVNDAPDGFPNAAGLAGPRGLHIDGAGTLWVSDSDNSRIVGYDTPLGSAPDQLVADRVLGKKSFVDTSANIPSANRMNNPTGVAIDTSVTPNRLWVVDVGNNRVLGFDSTALSSNASASVVLGQPSFTDGATNAGINGPLQNAVSAVASASSMFFPEGVAVDTTGAVLVADLANSRVLKFNDPFRTDSVADVVFGQPNFTTRNPTFWYGSATSLAGPQGVSADPGNNVWVADTLDHRVVRFPPSGGAANLVVGQAGFVSSTTFPPYVPGCSATLMNSPVGVSMAPSGRVHVADFYNNRVLVFSPPFTNGMSASAVFGQADFNSCSANRGGAPSAQTLSQPHGAWEDASGNVYIADYGNNRVLVYNTPFGSGGDFAADQVLGQPDFTTTSIAPTSGPVTLASPSGLAIDSSQRLFVADRENSRVLLYGIGTGPFVLLDPIPSPVVVGSFVSLSGSGFTAGSRIMVFVATAEGPVAYGPYTPNNWSAGYLVWLVDPEIRLGNGFGTFMVVNTDQGYVQSNTQSQLLYGSWITPTITMVNGVALRPADPTIPTANVETVVSQGATVTLTGMGFSNTLVNLFTAAGNKGPLTPLPGATPTQIQVVVPPDAPTGPGSFQAVNSPYTGNVLSNAVSVPIGALVTISHVSLSGDVVTVTGTGFCSLTVINLFAPTASGVQNLGGLNGSGSSNIPLTIDSPTQFHFTRPGAALAGVAYVMAINPPFIAYSSSGVGPSGGILFP